MITEPEVVMKDGEEQGMTGGSTNVTVMDTPENAIFPSLVNVTFIRGCDPVTAEGNEVPLARSNCG